MIKPYCVSCLKKYKQDQERYKHNGNYCSDCLSAISKMMGLRQQVASLSRPLQELKRRHPYMDLTEKGRMERRAEAQNDLEKLQELTGASKIDVGKALEL